MDKDPKIQALYSLLAKLDDPEDIEALFEDMCTRKEVSNMAERLHAAKLLMAGNTYNQVDRYYDYDPAQMNGGTFTEVKDDDLPW